MILIIILLSSFQTTNQKCPLMDQKLYFAHRGGNTDKFHENTMDIFVDSAKAGHAIELDLMLLESGEIICYHDLNFEKKIGVNRSVIDSEWSTVKNYMYKKSYDDKEYNITASIPLFNDVVNEICKIKNNIGIWIDIKTFLGRKYSLGILEALENSPCVCDDSQILVLEVYNQPKAIFEFEKLRKKFRCNFLYAFSYYEFEAQEKYEEFEKKLKFQSKFADIFDFDAAIIEKYPEIVNQLYRKGICSSIYGEDNKKDFTLFQKYNNINLLISDLQSTPIENEKESNIKSNLRYEKI